MTTANDIPPNIVILMDNGAEMEKIITHSGYPPNYTASGSSFIIDNDYNIIKSGNSYCFAKIDPVTLLVGNCDTTKPGSSGSTTLSNGATAATFTINGRTITLPAERSSSVDSMGIKDSGTANSYFRYTQKYLNWIFFGSYAGNGSDLPNVTRFYNAKSALMTVAKKANNLAQFSIYNFTSNSSGASSVQPLGMVVNTPLAALPENNTLQSNYVNNINNMGTVIYSPLAEGLASIGGYYASQSSHVAATYCQKLFALVVSPGVSSEDESPDSQGVPRSLSDYDGDNSGIGEGNIKGYFPKDVANGVYYPPRSIPKKLNGTTYLDDVAYYLYKNDIVGYQPGFQNVRTYTVGFMGDVYSNLFLINTSNNGNGNLNLYDNSNPEYGKYFYYADRPEALAEAIINAVSDIIAQTNSFTAPVVPVTRTTSGDKIFMAFFKPGKTNFWEGNVTKFGLNANLAIVDSLGQPATDPNGAIKEGAKPYWQTKDWATPGKSNYILNSARTIYTYLGDSNLTAFTSTNITSALLGNPTRSAAQIINYIRGADVFDENRNGDTTENRAVITGDVLHSEPLVFNYYTPTSPPSEPKKYVSYVFFGSNDGMLHAVKDASVDESASPNAITINYGTEVWAFIPPDILPKLKNIVEGIGHQIYVDSSPKIYFFDTNKNGVADLGEKVILVCGERKGGSSYFALDITNPLSPKFLWRIDNANNTTPSPNFIIPNLGQSWSEPQFGLVKTSSGDTAGTPVFFIGAGYSSNNTSGKAILAIDILTGEKLYTFTNPAMNSIASNVLAIDENDNGFIDKVYVGDLGGRMWRLGNFTGLTFPQANENINNWVAHNIFVSPSTATPTTPTTPPAPPSQFYYPPSLTLEYGYDLLFFGTGDRENACFVATCADCVDRFYVVKDRHNSTTLNNSNLVDVTTSTSLTNTSFDSASINGWYIKLAAGEKVLAENTVFYKVAYFTTFTPTSDPCVPGGDGRAYAMSYKTGGNAVNLDKDTSGTTERSVVIGGGIPSKPVMVVTDSMNPSGLLISVGSTNPDENSQSFNAGVIKLNPLAPEVNFLYRWWRELTNW
jgi:type IV pilus assembly protein PilY1